jgi:hypothetical protein
VNPTPNPIDAIKGVDAYFGALPLSDDTLIEEFGFVPSATLEPREAKMLDGGVIIHENEYEELQQMYQDKPTDKELLIDSVPLRDITNQMLPLRGTTAEFKLPIVTIDQKLNAELELTLQSLMMEPAGLTAVEETVAAMLDKQPHCLERQLPELQPRAESRNIPIDRGDDCEIRQKRHALDLYTPRWVRGKGHHREGFCEICGVWLKIKQSAYWYHMNFIHGISASTGRPYEPPADTRERRCRRATGEEIRQVEGLCVNCDRWVVLQHRPLGEDPVLEDCSQGAWWRHAQKCVNGNADSKLIYRKRVRRSYP